MDSRKFILSKTRTLLVGQVFCVAAMCGIFALMNRFDGKVLLGGIIGAILSVLNFLFLAISADKAADQATGQDVKGGLATIRMSYGLRLALLFIILIAFAKSGLCNVLALALPLAFAQPIIMITEFFAKGR